MACQTGGFRRTGVNKQSVRTDTGIDERGWGLRAKYIMDLYPTRCVDSLDKVVKGPVAIDKKYS